MFTNRTQAGKLLADKIIGEFRPKADQPRADDIRKLNEKIVILSIPRGGVMVGKEIAQKLGCLHDVVVTKKLRAPHQAELAIGAVGETKGSLFIDKRLATDVHADEKYLRQEIVDRQAEIKRREQVYRQGRKTVSLSNKIVILVDDGAATGATMIAAAREAWSNNPQKVIIALPVCAKDTFFKLEKEVDAVITLDIPEIFYAVGQFYESFPQVSDEEVIKILRKR